MSQYPRPSYKECLYHLANGGCVGIGEDEFEIYEASSSFLEMYQNEEEYSKEEMQIMLYEF